MTTDDHTPGSEPDSRLTEIITRNREVTRLRNEWESLRQSVKDAKADLEDAQDQLNKLIRSLDEEHPLFDRDDAKQEINEAFDA